MRNNKGMFMKGNIPSLEIREKISKANKGNSHTQSQETKDKISNKHKGKILSIEHKLKLSNSHKGKVPWNKGKIMPQITGKKHHNWQGGKSFEAYPKEFCLSLKGLIRSRDGNMCLLCGKRGKEVHHINYNKKDCRPENLITLCKKCHCKTNFNREKYRNMLEHPSDMRMKYQQTFAELCDRLSIVTLKSVKIAENKENYEKEAIDIMHDLNVLIHQKNLKLTGNIVRALLVLSFCNETIWSNESKARQGGTEQDKLLKFTHSVNGIRNLAKNVISNEIGERQDLKLDCLAAELCKTQGYDFGGIFET